MSFLQIRPTLLVNINYNYMVNINHKLYALSGMMDPTKIDLLPIVMAS